MMNFVMSKTVSNVRTSDVRTHIRSLSTPKDRGACSSFNLSISVVFRNRIAATHTASQKSPASPAVRMNDSVGLGHRPASLRTRSGSRAASASTRRAEISGVIPSPSNARPILSLVSVAATALAAPWSPAAAARSSQYGPVPAAALESNCLRTRALPMSIRNIDPNEVLAQLDPVLDARNTTA